MTYATEHLGIDIEYRHALPGVVDLNIKSAFVQACFIDQASHVRDVTIVSEHVGDVYVNGKQMTALEPHEVEDYAALEKLRMTLELDTSIPHTIYTFAEIRVRRYQAELTQCRAALALAQKSLKELVVDPETDFGPSHALAEERRKEAIAAAKAALRRNSIHDIMEKRK